MSDQRIHYVTTSDGVTIGGTVHGHGPPLVFVHGIIGDGDLDWQALLPHLVDRFTCHLLSNRGRRLSDDHPDLSSGRLVDDILTYVDSLGEPAKLVGWSAGADLVLAAAGRSGAEQSDAEQSGAEQSDALDGVAVYEPALPVLMDEEARAGYFKVFARMAELAAEGRLADAMRAFAGVPFNDDELAVAEAAGYLEAAGRYVPNLLSTIEQQPEHRGPTPDDPALLGAIAAPVLVLHGSETKPFIVRNVRHVAEHVRDATLRVIPGAGHAASLTHPKELSSALTAFFAPA